MGNEGGVSCCLSYYRIDRNIADAVEDPLQSHLELQDEGYDTPSISSESTYIYVIELHHLVMKFRQ